MSQADVSSFNWPTAASGATNVPMFTLDPVPARSTVPFMKASTVSWLPITQPAGTGILSSVKTVHTTVTSIVLEDPAAGFSTAWLIHQTKPLDFVAPLRPTKISNPAPEMTVAAFEFYTPTADASVADPADATPTKSKSGPTPAAYPSDTHTTFASNNFGAKITGIVVGSVVFVFLVGLALTYWRARHRTAEANESVPVDMEAILEEKRKRAEYLGLQRWSSRSNPRSMDRFLELRAKMAANAAAKKGDTEVKGAEGTILEIQNPQVRHDQARRPSGLEMHPPARAAAECNDSYNECAGTKQSTTQRTAAMSSETPINAEDCKIGHIPLPVFIPMYIFTPSLLAIMVYFVYLKTVKMYRDKTQLAKQDEEAAPGMVKEVEVTQDVEQQVRAFIDGVPKK
ncbi:hypothetical protein E8E12_009061 [Didymella heteroderae]|uniref:Uncharacterized protein n=1 Tax=Didymella heteroderae TaxID=1769908 RepID=A0A9P4WUC2_9PLEO|nr:hypothetical protein E8E12_009061 [Didymella heteroderae]